MNFPLIHNTKIVLNHQLRKFLPINKHNFGMRKFFCCLNGALSKRARCYKDASFHLFQGASELIYHRASDFVFRGIMFRLNQNRVKSQWICFDDSIYATIMRILCLTSFSVSHLDEQISYDLFKEFIPLNAFLIHDSTHDIVGQLLVKISHRLIDTFFRTDV